jgi:hypothetical protein
MPTYTTGTHGGSCDDSGLPRSLREYLATGAEKGNRDNALFAAACQARDAGLSQSEAEQLLVSRAVADGLSEAVARRKIKSAYSKAPREPAGGACSSRATAQNSNAAAAGVSGSHKAPPVGTPLPAPIRDGFKFFLETLFEDGERVAIGQGSRNGDGSLAIDYGDVRLRKMWLKDGPPRNPEGIFSRINPMQYRGAKNEDVTAYRHTLIEFDLDKNGQRVAKEIQYTVLLESGFPISTVVDSGKKSLQALVRVDASDKHEYDERVEAAVVIQRLLLKRPRIRMSR